MNLKKENLKNILNFAELEKLFKNYSLTSGLDVTFYDEDGKEELCVRKKNNICNFARDNEKCRQKIVSSGKKAAELGSAYIYETPCGLIMCITPLTIEGQTLGYITTGPVVLWDKDDYFLADFEEKRKKLGINPKEGEFDLQDVKQMDCASMTSVSETLTMLVNYMVREEMKYIEQRLKISRMNMERMRAAQEMKIHEKSASRCIKYPIGLEKELITAVQLGDKTRAKQIINRFLNEIFSFASGDLEIVKAKLYEFTAFLSRSAVEAGAPLSSLTGIIKKNSKLLLENADFSEICRETVDILEDFLDAVYISRGKKNTNEHLYRALRYINEHFTENINLDILAQNIFVSGYYLSHLFRKEMGVTFSDYLSKVRIERAKELLMEGKSVEDTAEAVGYGDGNYFIKIFKKYVGITPSKYRKSMVE